MAIGESCGNLILPNKYKPKPTKSRIQIIKNVSRLIKPHCSTKSALDKNFNAKPTSIKPKTTFTLFNQPPERGREFNQAGKAAKKAKGKANATAKFDETVDIVFALGVDPRHADQMVRGVIGLPNGTGKSVRVAVFARGDKAEKAKAAGAELVGAEDLMEKIQQGEMDFDRCIATPDMMAVVGRLGKVLGPRGLMPNPKLGTVTQDVEAAVKAAKGGQIEYRVEKAGIIHVGVGKISFEEKAIAENVKTLVNAVVKAKPTGVKGTYFKNMSLTSTMGPGLSIDTASAIGE